jgi:hypothetical protein
VSWDEALDYIAKRMRAVGPEAVGLWAGHGGFTPGGTITVQMMQRFANMYTCSHVMPPVPHPSLAASKLNLPQKETPPRGARAFSLGSRHRKWEEAVKRSDYAKGRV